MGSQGHALFVKSRMVKFTHVAHNFTGLGQPSAAEIQVLFCTHVSDLHAKHGIEVTDLPLPHGMWACSPCFACVASVLFILLELRNKLHSAPP